MKKSLTWILLLTVVFTIVVISCNKQKLTIVSDIKEGVSIKDGRYVFANRNIFESYVNELGKMSEKELDALEEKLHFKSRRSIQNKLEEIQLNKGQSPIKTESSGIKVNTSPVDYELTELIDDIGFASVLNEQYIIQIDDEIFNVNIINGYVYVLDESNQQYLPQLEDAYLEPGVIYRYEMGLPVLDILDGGGNGTDPCMVDPSFCAPSVSNPISGGVCNLGQSFENGVCNGCAGTGHEKVQNDKEYYVNSIGKDKNRWESKIVYQPMGIWFSMISKLENRVNAAFSGGSNYDPTKPEVPSSYGGTVSSDSKTTIRMINRSEYNFRKRCRNREVGNENSGNGYSIDEKKEYRFYSGTRCLKDYCVTSNFGIYEYMGRGYGGIPLYKSNPTEWTLTLKSY